MINHKNFCRSLAKKGGTITLSLNDQPNIGAFSIGKEGSVLGVPWERAPKTGSVLGASFRGKQASGVGAREWGALPRNIGLDSILVYRLTVSTVKRNTEFKVLWGTFFKVKTVT